jgi:hypothetical protein
LDAELKLLNIVTCGLFPFRKAFIRGVNACEMISISRYERRVRRDRDVPHTEPRGRLHAGLWPHLLALSQFVAVSCDGRPVRIRLLLPIEKSSSTGQLAGSSLMCAGTTFPSQ